MKKTILFICVLVLFSIFNTTSILACSAWGHVGQSIFLMSYEMPKHVNIYKPVFGEKLFSMLTSMDKSGNFHFDLDNLNPVQKAFTLGAVGPDKYDISQYLHRSKIFFPLHNVFPQRILNLLDDITMRQKSNRFLVARAYYYGFAFHYMGDIIFHPGMYKPTKYRVTRDYEVHGPEHVIFESLLDKIGVYYWFLKHRELGIYPSKVIKKIGLMKPVSLYVKMRISSMHKMFKNVNLNLVALIKTVFSPNKKISDNAFKKAFEKKEFLSNALYDKSLKRFVKNTITPENERAIMNGTAKLEDFFPKEIHAKTSATEGVKWFGEIIKSGRTGFAKLITRKDFAINLDYGTPTKESPLTDKDKRILIKLFNKSINQCIPKNEFLFSE